MIVPDFPAPSTALRVDRLRNDAECLRYRSAWNDLAADIPFRRWEWLGTWWKHYGNSNELFVLVVVDDQGVLRGVAPWYLDTSHGRTIRFLGDGKVCTDYLTILCRACDRVAVVRAIVAWLCNADDPQSPDHWHSLELEGVLVGDPGLDELLAEMQRHRHPVAQRPAAACYSAQLPASVDDYIRSRGKTNRLTMRRIQRKLAAGIQNYRHLTAADSLQDEDWELFVDLHGVRRATLKEDGCFQFPPFGAFLREATTLLMSAGMSSLLYVYDGETPMAVAHLLHNDHTTYMYQTGMDPGVREKRPGYVVFSLALWWTIERGARAFDLLRGDEPYKRTWRAQPQATRDIRISSQHLGPRLRHQWTVGRPPSRTGSRQASKARQRTETACPALPTRSYR
jgi:CelD/BcsL family acetyltransferase involved in cellulose biosynthesis